MTQANSEHNTNNNSSQEPQVGISGISQQTLENFATQLFRGRSDVWGSVEGSCNKEPVTFGHYQKHLKGERSLGIYPLLDDGTCHFAAIDLDVKDFGKALAIRQELFTNGIPTYIAESKKKGYHIYSFALDKFVAKDIRRILRHILNKLNISAEIFPKQDGVSPQVPYGNYLNLPCFGHTRPFLAADLKQVPLEEAIKRIQYVQQTAIDSLLQTLPEEKSVTPRQPLSRKKHPPCIEAILNGVDQPGRDEAAFALARHYLDLQYPLGETLELLKVWDKRNNPPFNDDHLLETKVRSAEKGYAFGCSSIKNNPILSIFCVGEDKCDWLKQAAKKPKGKPFQADRLVELAINEGIYLFKDEYGDPCARIKIRGHFENWRLQSRNFKLYLGGLLYQSEGKSANQDAVKNALSTLAAEALYGSQSKTYPLYNRVARLDDAIYYDLSDAAWRVVKITPEGWEILDDPPILFRRYKQQIPQVEPIKGGDPWLLFEVVRVPQELQLLLLTWGISCLVPDIPHTMPIATGPEGGAKSWLFYVLRNVIDPSVYRQLDLRGQHRELVQILAHNWCALFDNVSYLTEWQSDCLCRAVTGSGFSKRELYSEDEDTIYTFKRCVGLNAINLAIDRPDFLDRTILFPLDTIPEDERRSETDDLEPRFVELKPYIFGGMLDALAGAMAIKPSVKLKRKPRMADFAEWGYAISEALGHTGSEFRTAYDANIQSRHREILAETDIGFVVMSFMADKDSWGGTATKLLALLTSEAEAMGVNTNAKDFPKKGNALSAKLTKLKVTLAQNDIIVDKLINVGPAHERGFRIVKLSSKVETPSKASTASTQAQKVDDGEPGVDDKSRRLKTIKDDKIDDKIDDDLASKDDIDDISLPPEDF